VEAQRVTRKLPLLRAELGLVHVATSGDVVDLEAPALLEDHPVELADRLGGEPLAEQVLEREPVVQLRGQVSSDLTVELGVVPLLAGLLVQSLRDFLVLGDLLGGAGERVASTMRRERLDERVLAHVSDTSLTWQNALDDGLRRGKRMR
jgi:hypothetical protein